MDRIKYKIVSCDFDGTLLRSDNTISDYSREVIREFIKRGGIFMPNTGRMHVSIKKRMTDIGITENVPISSYQGAVITENVTDKLLFYKPLSFEDGLDVAVMAEKRGLYVQAYDNDDFIISEFYGEKSFGHYYGERLDIDFVKTDLKISEYIQSTGLNSTKLLIVAQPEDMKNQLSYFREAFPEMTFNTSEPYMMEVINKDAGKDRACDIICERAGLDISNCIAIGDSLNDFSMVSHAGLGVAVSNAVKELKDVARYIAESNDDDGVAKTIEKFCL